MENISITKALNIIDNNPLAIIRLSRPRYCRTTDVDFGTSEAYRQFIKRNGRYTTDIFRLCVYENKEQKRLRNTPLAIENKPKVYIINF